MSVRTNHCLRRGVAMVYAVVSLGVLVSFAALAIDVGFMYSARGEMQRTADASALAGASGLMKREVRQRACEYGLLNAVVKGPVVSSELDITIGNWDGPTRTFTPTPDEGVNNVLPNAVRVVGRRSNIDLFFAQVMGYRYTKAQAAATAVSGAGQCLGVWGIQEITLNGNVVSDSYDAGAGGYGPGNIRPNGDICSCGDIRANGGISVYGDAMYGEGFNFLPNGTSYTVTGTIHDQPCRVPQINIDWAAAAAANDNALITRTFLGRDPLHGTRLSIAADDHLTLMPGTYYFDSVMIVGQGYLEITGPTKIYIAGNAMLTGGGVVNVTQDPRNLVIYLADTTAMMSGTAAFYGAVIAPNTNLQVMGTFDAFGTVLTRSLTWNGDMNFHVDEGLVFDLFGRSSTSPSLVE